MEDKNIVDMKKEICSCCMVHDCSRCQVPTNIIMSKNIVDAIRVYMDDILQNMMEDIDSIKKDNAEINSKISSLSTDVLQNVKSLISTTNTGKTVLEDAPAKKDVPVLKKREIHKTLEELTSKSSMLFSEDPTEYKRGVNDVLQVYCESINNAISKSDIKTSLYSTMRAKYGIVLEQEVKDYSAKYNCGAVSFITAIADNKQNRSILRGLLLDYIESHAQTPVDKELKKQNLDIKRHYNRRNNDAEAELSKLLADKAKELEINISRMSVAVYKIMLLKYGINVRERIEATGKHYCSNIIFIANDPEMYEVYKQILNNFTKDDMLVLSITE